jgi:hypothetical protein
MESNIKKRFRETESVVQGSRGLYHLNMKNCGLVLPSNPPETPSKRDGPPFQSKKEGG